MGAGIFDEFLSGEFKNQMKGKKCAPWSFTSLHKAGQLK
jgi:hypothetical protein